MKLLLLAGSAREDSLNQKLQRQLADFAEQQGFTVNLYPAAALEAPLYHGDLEAEKGLPEATKQLVNAIQNADKVVIVSPEYNASVPPLLKNAIDWSSRDKQGVWAGKLVLLAAASPGGLGGIRGLNHLRDVLGNVQAWVAPLFMSVKNASAESIAQLDGDFVKKFLHQGDA